MGQTGNILEQIKKQGIVLGDGGYLIELERRGWVDSGSGREKVGTGKGSGQFTPEVAIEHPDALARIASRISERRFPGFAGAYVFRHPGKIKSRGISEGKPRPSMLPPCELLAK